MKKIISFMKKYGFYLSIGVICIISLAAVFVMPYKNGNVDENANPYAHNETADGRDLQENNEKNTLEGEVDKLEPSADSKEQITEPSDAASLESDITPSTEVANGVSNEKDTLDAEEEASSPEVKTETFESTTASISEEPFFAEGDTLLWPADGKVVVPYTDESTSHWYSDSLNQTMRTFGICISGEKDTEVKAVAKGTVVEVVEDSTSYLETGMPYVGKLMVVDLGNGYKAIYGFQGGSVNEKLVGQVVNAGDVLGNMGSPKGAFISQGDNIYLQITHNDKVINPLNILENRDSAEKADGVDLGFSK